MLNGRKAIMESKENHKQFTVESFYIRIEKKRKTNHNYRFSSLFCVAAWMEFMMCDSRGNTRNSTWHFKIIEIQKKKSTKRNIFHAPEATCQYRVNLFAIGARRIRTKLAWNEFTTKCLHIRKLFCAMIIMWCVRKLFNSRSCSRIYILHVQQRWKNSI